MVQELTVTGKWNYEMHMEFSARFFTLPIYISFTIAVVYCTIIFSYSNPDCVTAYHETPINFYKLTQSSRMYY